MAGQNFGAGTLIDVLDPAAEPVDREAARALAQRLREMSDHAELLIRTRSGGLEPLPRGFAALIASMLEEAAAGHTVALVSEAEEVSTSVAAEFLGVSRPHVVKLIDSGLLPGRMAGTHRRVRMTDLLAYKRSLARRHAALDELAAEAQEMGLYDAPPTHFVR
ncbi:MAG TPA: helix-turn-helix domain-containing protein [Longimicrobium sp.]|nr:helix-turn-helix domain-containing protein [Longimicrobium sp.]